LLEPIQTSLERILNDQRLHAAPGKGDRRHILKLEVVERKTIYGYYPDAVPFVKVTLLNPTDVAKVMHILEVGPWQRNSTQLSVAPCSLLPCRLLVHPPHHTHPKLCYND
jgi:hypothetical protein